MKKSIFIAFVATSLFACKNNNVETKSTIPANAVGYIIDSSAHTDFTKKLVDIFITGDLAANKAMLLAGYSDTAKIHDNKNVQTFAENIDTYTKVRASGVKFANVETPIVWETVLNKPAPNGVTSYVHAYYTCSIEKGGKKEVYTMNIVWDFVGDKVVSEWDLYDSAPVTAVLQ